MIWRPGSAAAGGLAGLRQVVGLLGLSAALTLATASTQAQTPTPPRTTEVAQGSQESAAAPTRSALDALLFYQLLIGEIELRQGQPAVAFEHLCQHAQKMSVQTPAGLNKNALSITTTANGNTTAADVLERLASDPEFVRQHGTEVARAMISARSELRRAAGDLAKASTLLTPEEFSKGLRAAMSLFVSHVEDVGAKRCATRIMGFIRKHFDVDLVDRNPAALELIERELREDHNCSLRDFCQAIEDRSRGVRLLSDCASAQPQTEGRTE